MKLLSSLIEPVTGIIDKVVADKDQAAKLAHEIATMSEKHAQQALLAQLEINKAEASSGSVFKGGWRPAVGWVCALGFAVNFLVSPIAAGFGVAIPQADTSVMMPVLMGMLGLGGLRSFEKVKKVSS
jgi:hypothetical protein